MNDERLTMNGANTQLNVFFLKNAAKVGKRKEKAGH